MNGNFLIILRSSPFVPSINSVQALRLSKDSERVSQRAVLLRLGFQLTEFVIFSDHE